MKRLALASAASLSLLFAASHAWSNVQIAGVSQAKVTSASYAPAGSITSTFAPRPRSSTQIDYSAWDELLKNMVFYGGPSLRERARRPYSTTGTRFVFGHTSPYRFEGNRVMFDTMKPEFKGFLADYLEDLVSIGNQIEIPSLTKDEQLSYWLNLHNALVITALSEAYPTDRPSRLRGDDGLRFHDSKRVSIDGVELSLRDIREEIVYRHWSDPLVIYGFFHGDIGSPSIQRAAYTADTLRQTLKFSAQEFVNSLRAFHTDRTEGNISRHYQDAAPYFFPDFDADLRLHLTGYMDPDVASELRRASGTLTVMEYPDDIADLTKGDGSRRPISQTLSIGRDGLGARTVSPQLSQALEEYKQKFKEVRERGLSGTVIIEDIETEDPDRRRNGNTVD